MKYLIIILLLSSCTYKNICSKALQLKQIDTQLAKEYKTLKEIESQEWNVEVANQIVEQGDIIESLEIEKTLIQLSSDCQ